MGFNVILDEQKCNILSRNVWHTAYIVIYVMIQYGKKKITFKIKKLPNTK